MKYEYKSGNLFIYYYRLQIIEYHEFKKIIKITNN